MATVKVFDEGSGKWVSVTSNNANGIMSGSSELVDLVNDCKSYTPKKTTVSIEEVLECLSEKIKVLYGNVSWLAKLGGNDRLPDDSTEFIYITVNEVRRESITGVIIREGQDLTIVVKGPNSLPDLDMIALSGNKVIKRVRDVRPNSPIIITQGELLAAGISLEDFNLQITAKLPDKPTNLIWYGTVFII